MGKLKTNVKILAMTNSRANQNKLGLNSISRAMRRVPLTFEC